MKFSISQFYPCSKVELGSELYYICELGKYLKEDGHALSLDGISLSSELRVSKYWNYLYVAYVNGWVTDLDIDFGLSPNTLSLRGVRNILITEDSVEYDFEEQTKRRNDYEYSVFTPERKQVVFFSKSDDLWTFSRLEDSLSNSINLQSLKNDYSSQSWVSLTAYVAVHRSLHDSPKALSLVLTSDYTMCSLSFADMTLLLEETDALNGWCFTDIGLDTKFSYESWWFKHNDRGYLSRFYTAVEKLAEFKKLGFYEGDVVFLYERDKCQQLNKVKSVSSCNYAIIRSVDDTGLVLDVFYTTNTRYGEQVRFDSFPESLQAMYVDSSYKECRHSIKSISWLSIGVEYMLFDESFFISRIDDKVDCLTIQAMSSTLEEREFNLDCVNAIYWLFKDHSIEFNEDAYRKKYLKHSTAMYDLFLEGKL